MGTNKEVDAWFARYANPMKPVVMRMREIILDADDRVSECIKWQAPTFVFEGNLASFYPKSKQHASLMFHQGAKIPGKHARLEGTGDTSRVMKLGSLEEAEAAKGDLERIVTAWCAWRSADAPKAPKTTKAKPAKKVATTTKVTRAAKTAKAGKATRTRNATKTAKTRKTTKAQKTTRTTKTAKAATKTRTRRPRRRPPGGPRRRRGRPRRRW